MTKEVTKYSLPLTEVGAGFRVLLPEFGFDEPVTVFEKYGGARLLTICGSVITIFRTSTLAMRVTILQRKWMSGVMRPLSSRADLGPRVSCSTSRTLSVKSRSSMTNPGIFKVPARFESALLSR